MQSLQARLGISLALALILIFGAHAWLMASFPRYLTEEYVATRLEHDAQGLLGRLQLSPDGQATLSPASIAPIYRTPLSGHYFRITVADQVIRSRSLGDADLELPGAPPGRTAIHHVTGPQGQPLLVWLGGFERSGRPVSIAVAENLTHMEGDIRELQLTYLAAVAVTLAVLLIAQGLVVRLSLRPVQQARDDCMRIESGEGQALREAVPTEVRPLVQEINRLVQILHQRLQRSRDALGNLAHALNTPLSVLRQLDRSATVEADPDLRQSLHQQIDRMQEIIEHELKRARLAGGVVPGRQFQVRAELESLVRTLGKLYAEKGLDIRLTAPPEQPYPGEREDMLELFGNLLDNACKWARHRVELRFQAGAGLLFSVDDDGPGGQGQPAERFTRRGVRLDESKPGHGLGLAIVRDIVEQYGGSIAFSDSELGGLRVTVELPIPR